MTTSALERSISDHTRLRNALILDPRVKTATLFTLVVVVMGSGYVATRLSLQSVPPLYLAALRLYLSAAVLFSVTLVGGRRWRINTSADWTAVVVLGVLVFAATIGFLFVGQQSTTASTAAIVMCLGPVMTICLSRLLLPDERLSGRQLAGIGFGLFGAIVVANPGASNPELNTGIGVGLVFCAAASGSAGSVLLSRGRTTLSLTVLAAWGSLLGGLILHAASIGFGEPVKTVVWTPTLLALLAYLSVVIGGVGYVGFLVLLRTIGPTRTSFTSYAIPVVATLLGWAILREPLTATLVLGFGLIVIGFVLLNRVRDDTE